jgi:divalent metal cation (Fe/Co/Zn/Cd) transporter
MLAPALTPFLVLVGLVALAAFGAWPFGPLAAAAVGLVCFALAIVLVRFAARLNGPEPPRRVTHAR